MRIRRNSCIEKSENKNHMSKQTGLTAILLLLMLPGLWAQKKLNYPEAEKRSYELFKEKKWAELIDFGKLARARGIDFFYLQARTGIAFYNLKRYRKAAKWFYKAWENDQSFEWLQEYLYYSLLLGGRQTEASKIA